MTMSLLEELDKLGVDTELSCKRFMNNVQLYERMLRKFNSTAQGLEVLPCFEQQDYKTALERAHTMKGITGNLSLTPLYKAYSDIVYYLRDDDHEKAERILRDMLPIQERIIKCIEDSNQVFDLSITK